MNGNLPKETDVLVVGAGATGLTLALALQARGRDVTIVDKLPEGSNESRAAVVYPGSLELLDAYGVAERLVPQGIPTKRFTIRDRDRILTPVTFDKLHTRFPFALLVSQAVTEGTILERFKALGGCVLRPYTVTDVLNEDSGVTVRLTNGAQINARYVAGADGVHSVVRQAAGIRFAFAGRPASYALADVCLTGGVPDDERVVYFSPAGHLVVLPLPGRKHRVVAHVENAPERPDAAFLQEILDERGPETTRSTIHDVVWGSRFLTHHAIADRYRSGRVLLAGDAAHVHSPLGGQGMNLGIHDAVALAAALSNVLGGWSDAVLDGYSVTQRRIAKQVIWVTIVLTRNATMKGPARVLRNATLRALSPFVRRLLAWRLSLLYL